MYLLGYILVTLLTGMMAKTNQAEGTTCMAQTAGRTKCTMFACQWTGLDRMVLLLAGKVQSSGQ